MAKTDQNKEQHDPQTGELQSPDEAFGKGALAIELEQAQIDQLIQTAHRYPRKIQACLDMIRTMAIYNEAAAENCVYSLPRGGKPIIGPSIGFANILSQCWGNNRSGARIVHIDRKEKQVHAEGAFLDLQTNYQIIVPVNRRISNKDGRIYNDDMIMVTGQAAASIARRNAVLNAIPRALWFPIWEDALGIVRGSVETFAEKKDKAMKAFHMYGVKPEQLYMLLGLKGDADLNLDHVPILRGLFTQLRDGAMTVEEMFDPRRMTGTGFETVQDPLADVPAAGDDDGEEGAGKPQGEQQQASDQPGEKVAGTPAAATQQPAAKPKTPAKPKATPAKAKATAAAKPEEEKPNAGMAETTQANAQGAAPPAQAEPKPEVKPEPEPAKGAVPTDSESYRVYAEAKINSATNASELENWWKGERDLRGKCSVIEDTFANLYAACKAKVAELRAAAEKG